jgi:hypothetical protein
MQTAPDTAPDTAQAQQQAQQVGGVLLNVDSIRAVLNAHGGRKTAAARALNIDAGHVSNILKTSPRSNPTQKILTALSAHIAWEYPEEYAEILQSALQDIQDAAADARQAREARERKPAAPEQPDVEEVV